MMQPTPAPTSPPGSPRERLNEDIKLIAPPPNKGNTPLHTLIELLQKLQIEKSRDIRKQRLKSWFNHWREENGYDLFPVLRLLLPEKDKERSLYRLKETKLAQTYIKLIPLGPKDPDATRLREWKKPTEKDIASGDFPSVLYDVVSKRSSVIQGSMTVEGLNEVLDALAQSAGSVESQAKILQRVYNETTPEEQRWIVRIILKDMNISVKETTIFSVFHPDAQDLYNTCSDLKKVAWTLWNPSHRLEAKEKTAQLFHAFTPMLCKRPTKRIEDSVKEMGDKPFIIEEKLDGERIQLHKRGNEYFYCSRKGKDYTYLYGSNVGTGSLTPYIHHAFDSRVHDIILDGEMLVWDPVSERNLPFGTLKTAAGDKSTKELRHRPCFKVFDILYLNGESLLEKSCMVRKTNLRACVEEIQGRLEFVIEFQGTNAKDVRQRMEDVMNAKGEGLVLKHPDSQYILNGRNKDWIKVKPEYMDNMGETVDVLVVAGNYGSGKRGGGVSTLICAVLDDHDIDEDEPKYKSFVRIGSGLSYSDFVWIRAKNWKTWDPKNPPSFLQTAPKSHDDKGDLYIEPADSFILKVKAAEITPSEQYAMTYTMRFPRALEIREDLSVTDCLTESALMETILSTKKRKLSADDDQHTKKKGKSVKKAKPTMFPEFKAGKVQAECDLFEGYSFVVFQDPALRKNSVPEAVKLRNIIEANGGGIENVVKRTKPPSFAVYDGSSKYEDVKRVIKGDLCDIIRSQWIVDCIKHREIVPLKKKYFFHATPQRESDDDFQNEDEDEAPAPSEDEDERMVSRSPSPMVVSKDTEMENKAGAPPDSETDNDSDGEDFKQEEDDDDDWFKVSDSTVDSSSFSFTQPSIKDESQEAGLQEVKMGENDDAMEYDQVHIFRHLCFYLDSPENARKNGMKVKEKSEAEVTGEFSQISPLIIDNGGRIVDLDDLKLTHILVARKDQTRRLELIKRTSQPKRRHLVDSTYIQACLEEGTLLNEGDFAP